MLFAGLIFFAEPATAAPEILGDLDEDGAVTVSDITLLVRHLQGVGILPAETVPFADIDQSGQVDTADIVALADRLLSFGAPEPIPLATIGETLPQQGESDVAVTRESVIHFTQPLAEDETLTNDNFFALFAGERLNTRIELASNRLKATLFYLEPLPSDARVRVVFDPSGVEDFLGRELDADSDGVPGGLTSFDFNTVSTTGLPGTAVGGVVFSAEKGPGGENVPLGGVVIEVAGSEEELRTTTESDGSFLLDPSPAGSFFVTIDGRPVTGGFPDGAYYPFVGKVWTAVAGRKDNLVNETGEIFLPLVAAGSLQPVSATEATSVNFPEAVIDENPDLAGVEVTVPANSLFDEGGARGGSVGIAPVPSDRIPEPLPSGLDLPLVITLQTDGPQNFDRPAPVRFPNAPDPETGETLAPGETSALWSFNHDTGEWEIAGPMTVTEDGQYIVSDPGVGIRQPGWHGSLPGTSNSGGGAAGGPAPPPPDDDGDDDDEKDCKTEAALAVSGVAQGSLATVASVPRSLPFGVGEGIGLALNGVGAQVDSLIAPEQSGDFWEGAAKNSAISATGTAIPHPYVEGAATYAALLDTWSSAGTRLGDLAACLAPLSLGSPDLVSVASFASGIQAAAFSESRYPLLAKFDEYVGIQFDFLFAAQDFFETFFGSVVWLAAGVEDRDGADAFITLIFKKLVDDFLIDEAEKNLLLNAPTRPAILTDQDVIDLIGLLNRRSAEGITEAERIAFLDAAQRMEAALKAIETQTPYDDFYFFWNFYLPDLWKEVFPPPARPKTFLVLSSGSGGGGGGGNGGSAIFISHPQAVPGEHHYLLIDQHDYSERRGRTNKLGQFDNLILAPNSLFMAFYYRPGDNEIAISIFRTPRSGERNRVPVSHFVDADEYPDADGDGAPDLAERITGTDPDAGDSDGDGVLDAAELAQDSDPLDDRAAATGLVATTPSANSLVDLAARDDLLVAVGEGSNPGLSIFDVRNGLDPSRVSETVLPADPLRVALDGDRAAVALGSKGLALFDIGDSAAPILERQLFFFPGNVTAVAMLGNLVFVGLSDGRIVTVDGVSGETISETEIASSQQEVVDLVADERYAYALLEGSIVAFERIAQAILQQRGSFASADLNFTSSLRRGHLFLGRGVLLSATLRGYMALNLSDRANPVLQANNDIDQFGWKQMALNGSGLMIAAASPNSTPDGPHQVDLYDVGISGFGSTFQRTFETSDLSRAVGIHNGLAFVGGSNSLSVIKYLEDDDGTQAPTISLASAIPGNNVEEGSQVTVAANVTDDVQVRNVAFFAGGERLATDGNYPFVATANVPILSSGATQIALHAVATDTAGNRTQSETLTFDIVEDGTPPSIVASIPSEGLTIEPPRRVGVVASEKLDPASLTASGFFLTSAGSDFTFDTSDDAFVTGGSFDLSEENTNVYLVFSEGLDPGRYRIAVNSAADLAGNALAIPFAGIFTVIGLAEADTDGDGLPDQVENDLGLNALDADTDDDGVLDGDEDIDSDGLSNIQEQILGTDLNDRDTDGDRLNDEQELSFGSDPLKRDTDGDGLEDNREFDLGTDPNGVDSDGDLLDDGSEFWSGTDPATQTILERTVSAPVIQYMNIGEEQPETQSAVSESVSHKNQ